MYLETECIFFKKFFNSLKDLFETVSIKCSTDKIDFSGLDSSQVCFTNATLDCSKFKKYECKDDTEFCISLDVITKIFKCCKNDDILILEKKTDDILNVIFKGTSKKKFQVRLIDDDSETNINNNLNYDEILTFDSYDFSNLIKELNMFGNDLNIELMKNKIIFKVNDSESKTEYEMDIECKHELSLKYALKYLLLITKSQPLSDEFDIYLSEEYPLKIELNMEYGKLYYYLAPKVNEDFD